MMDMKKISVGRIRYAFQLNEYETESLIQALWPDDLLPLELWQKTHENCWKPFLSCNKTQACGNNIALPESPVNSKSIQTYLLAHDVMDYFKQISVAVPLHVLQHGLNALMAETYGDIPFSYDGELASLLDSLKILEENEFLDQYSLDSQLVNKPVFTLPGSDYHVITNIFMDSILASRDRAIWLLRDFPLRKEAKGLAKDYINSFLCQQSSDQKPPITTGSQDNIPQIDEDETGKIIFYIPDTVWKGKTDLAILDTMKGTYPLPVIAYVLFYWAIPQNPDAEHKIPQGRKTQIGRLLTEKNYTDPKSYRNLVNGLLREADVYKIVKN